jgi:hypothetical protein
MTKAGFKVAVHEKLPKADSVHLDGLTIGEVAILTFEAPTIPTPKTILAIF